MAKTTFQPVQDEPKTSQEEPTKARPRDADGRMLDTWGLPLNGPARVRALDGRNDPALDPTGWEEVAAAVAAPTPPPSDASDPAADATSTKQD